MQARFVKLNQVTDVRTLLTRNKPYQVRVPHRLPAQALLCGRVWACVHAGGRAGGGLVNTISIAGRNFNWADVTLEVYGAASCSEFAVGPMKFSESYPR